MSRQSGKIKTSVKWLGWSATVIVTIGLLGDVPSKVIAQPRLLQLTQQSATLEDAKQFNQQVEQWYQKGKYNAAIPLAERALVIREKLLNKEDPLIAQSLNNLALLYREQGSYQKAEPLFLRSLAIYEKALSKEHVGVAMILYNLALLYQYQGNYQKAEPLYQRALVIFEKTLGKEHPFVAQSFGSLADLYRDQGNYQKAEPLYQRALVIFEKTLGKEHPNVAAILNRLALLYQYQGNYQKAEPMYQRALAIREKVLGKEHPYVASTLSNLALLYHYQGSYQKAEPLFQRALAIREKALGKEHPEVAASLDNLAELYKDRGKYQASESLFLRALAIREKILGREHPQVATTLNSLAVLYMLQGSYPKAEPLLLRALVIRKKVLGEEHPNVVVNLSSLALLYGLQGKYQQAEPLFLQVLAIDEKTVGKEHPDVATSLANLATLYREQGDLTRSTDYSRRALAVEEHNFNLIYAVGSEQRKQDYARTFIPSTNFVISLLLQQAPARSEVAGLALTTVLRRKGRVLDAVANNVQSLHKQVASVPETKQLFEQWLNIQQQQATLVYRGLEKQNPQAHQIQFQQLEAEKERLEEAISTKSASFRNVTQPVELKNIQAKIPGDAALVEIVMYKPFHAKAKQLQQWGKPRYAAAVLRSQGEPKWVDLGDVVAINKSVANLRNAISTEPTDDGDNTLQQVNQAARALDQQLMAPIRPLLGNAHHLLLSPDGQLTLIPFEALQDEQGKSLIQRYAFSYLTSGRDLLRFSLPTKSRSAPVVFADIDYDQQQLTATTSASKTIPGVQNRRSADLGNFKFPPLAAARQEAQAIKAVFPDTKILQGQQATETALKQLRGESILHLATHGFFIPDQPVELNANELNQPQTVRQLENPLLRSGIALAGFNDRQQTASPDDGVLTALEVAGLDLQGTQLVVLSACQTGLGDVKVGEGVYGLRRALVIAGSQTQVLSLWLVSDAKTQELMTKYYQKLKTGQGRHEALRQAQLELLNDPNHRHPYYWASFVPSGDWTPLKF
ncbi:CHAT domain-containing protein [Cyanobacteria bacterium FACHB-63]|nr:CHAT domain-containing protein [Cyanobacteria bacterium FACHB-63]